MTDIEVYFSYIFNPKSFEYSHIKNILNNYCGLKILIGLAATGYGAVAEVLGLSLLLVGASFSGTNLLAGIVGLVKFFTEVYNAKTEDDLKDCGRLFGDAVAKIGVNGLFFVMSMFGLKKASARLTAKTIADSKPSSGKWERKSFKEKVININEEPPVKRIEKQAEVKFKIKEKFDTTEYKRQLKNQEDGLNKLTIQEYLDNVENYKKNGRGAEATKVQKQLRKDAFNSKIEELRDSEMSYSEAKKQAVEWIKTQSTLHNPDICAGGNPLDVTDVGDARINSSIGSQWGNGNAKLLEIQIRDSIKSIDSKDYTTTYLNVKLTSD